MKFIDKLLDERSDTDFNFFWQIIGPLFVLCTFALEPNNFFIFCVGILGLFLCARWQMTGLLYSLVLLVAAGVLEHFFLNHQHLWWIGIEGSYAVAFYITALNAERHTHFVQSLFSQLDAKNSSLANLEEDALKSKESATSQQILLQEKGDLLQARLDELSSEYSSLLVLNEVLRKTSARESADKELLQGDLLDLQSRLGICLAEEDALKKELARLKESHTLILENSQLIGEINQVRLEKEQTHMINETLARLHAKESMRAQSAFEQLSILEKEKQETDLKVAEFDRLKSDLEFQLKEAITLRDRYKIAAEQNEAIQTERNFLKDRVTQAEFELAQKSQVAAVDLSQYVPKEELECLQNQVKALFKVKALHKQLKEQFEEKNQVLHKTRAELFQVDNALQALQIEVEGRDFAQNSIPNAIVSEVAQLEEMLTFLEQENEELQNLVTHLSIVQEAPKRKKKVKTTPEQDLLF